MAGRIGDRVSFAIMGIVCCGTFVALALTSVAKKANLTGPPSKQAQQQQQPQVDSKDFQKHFEEQLRQLDRRK